VISSAGSVLDEVGQSGSRAVIGEMSSDGSGLELCIADGEICYLYTWDSLNDEFDYLDRKVFNLSDDRGPMSLACAELTGDSYEDIVFCTITVEVGTPLRGVLVYDWEESETVYNRDWTGASVSVYPAAGRLAGTAQVGFPFSKYDHRTENPAALIIPSSSTISSCEEGTSDADMMNYGVFADWDPFTSGADTFVLPSEMQAMAWDEDGDAITDWPTPVYQDAEQGSSVGPSALADIDNSDDADVVFSTMLDGTCAILAFDSDGEYPDGSDIPFSLPDGVVSFGGFSLADIDRDGTIEIVFGTSDGKLHCWELGSCSTGYAPWPQFQHDDRNSGVLE